MSTDNDITPPDNDIIPPDAISSTPGAKEPATVIYVTFTLMKGADAVSATRRMLKHAGRSCGLRCVNIEERGWPGIVPLPSAKNLSVEAE